VEGDKWNERGAIKALDLLLKAPEPVRRDWRCARLILDLFWLTRAGKRLLQGERETVAFSPNDWEESLRICDLIEEASVFDTYRIDFLRGLALFHLGRYRASMTEFEELDRSAVDYSNRVIGTYLASNADGSPAKFTGQVRSVMPDGRRGKVWVDELRIELPFFPYRFGRFDTLNRGDPLPEFYIAFNMRGPYADPIQRSS
jgi:hypothetical protein